MHDSNFNVSVSGKKAIGKIKASQTIPATTVAMFDLEKNTLNMKQYVIIEMLYTNRNTKSTDQSAYIDRCRLRSKKKI